MAVGQVPGLGLWDLLVEASVITEEGIGIGSRESMPELFRAAARTKGGGGGRNRSRS